MVSFLMYYIIIWFYSWVFSVDQSKGMLGAFAPQKEPYVYALKEDTTPSGALARGVYSAKLKVWESKKYIFQLDALPIILIYVVAFLNLFKVDFQSGRQYMLTPCFVG